MLKAGNQDQTAAGCIYSTTKGTVCRTDQSGTLHCETTAREFRKCPGRDAEERVKLIDGAEEWKVTKESKAYNFGGILGRPLFRGFSQRPPNRTRHPTSARNITDRDSIWGDKSQQSQVDSFNDSAEHDADSKDESSRIQQQQQEWQQPRDEMRAAFEEMDQLFEQVTRSVFGDFERDGGAWPRLPDASGSDRDEDTGSSGSSGSGSSSTSADNNNSGRKQRLPIFERRRG